MLMQRLRYLVWLLIVTLLMGCLSDKTPEDVTEGFWMAIAASDRDVAEAWTTANSQALIEPLQGFRISNVEVLGVQVDQGVAEVATRLTQQEGQILEFSTVLLQNSTVGDGTWQVDARLTSQNLMAAAFEHSMSSLERWFEGGAQQLMALLQLVGPELMAELQNLQDAWWGQALQGLGQLQQWLQEQQQRQQRERQQQRDQQQLDNSI